MNKTICKLQVTLQLSVNLTLKANVVCLSDNLYLTHIEALLARDYQIAICCALLALKMLFPSTAKCVVCTWEYQYSCNAVVSVTTDYFLSKSATVSRLFNNYSRTPLTRSLKGNENLFELAGFRVIGVSSYRGRLKYSIFQVNN